MGHAGSRGSRLPWAPGHSFLCLFIYGIGTLVCFSQHQLPVPWSSPSYLSADCCPGPRNTCQLAVASGSKGVPCLQTVYPGGTLCHFPKAPLPPKGLLTTHGGRTQWTLAPYPLRGPVSTARLQQEQSTPTSPAGMNSKTKQNSR